MAYTSVIPVRRLDRTVDYVQNKAKTTPKSLEEAVDYAANRDKTESACFETGLGCTTTSAFEDMRLNTLRWHKETGVQGYHLVQSFAEGEVTPELAHQIGVEFAEQLLHGKYQAIVTTHLNTKHYHNHIVWSAVSLEDGNVSKQKKNKKRSGAFRRRKTSGRMSRKLVALFLGVMLVFVALAIDITYVNATKGEKLSEQIRKKIQKGKPLDQIADELEEVPETIRPLYEKIKQEMLQ